MFKDVFFDHSKYASTRRLLQRKILSAHGLGRSAPDRRIDAMNADTGVWKPHVTVAAVVERDGKFLLIEEATGRGALYNQPAGHLEAGESLLAAVIRETLEESARHFVPRALLGIYQYHDRPNDTTYMRFAFIGDIIGHDENRALDTGIIRALWMTPAEIRACHARHRTPLVMQCVDDSLAGKHYPLQLITHHA
jgi:ADP-ribose pyrophosphatase YjhB (NUDIX family)